jgi:hypothetical protein
MAENNTQVKIIGDASGAQEAMRQAAASVKNGVAQMKGGFESLQGVFTKFNGIMIGLSAALAGGAMFKDSIEATMNLTKESMSLGKQFGMTATEASILKVALDDVFVSQDTLSTAANKLTTTMRTNEVAITSLGVKTRDASGHFRSTFDVMQDVNKRLLDFKEGIDRNIEGQKIYGRSWAEVAPTLKLTAEVMEEARKKAEALGLLVGEENVQQVKAYRSAMNEIDDVMLGIKKTIGDALMPSLIKSGQWFGNIGPQAVDLTRRAIVILTDVISIFTDRIKVAWNVLAMFVEFSVTALAMVADIAIKTAKGDWTGVKASWEAGMDQIKDVVKTRSQNIKDAMADAANSGKEIFAAINGTLPKSQVTESKAPAGGVENSSGGQKKSTAGNMFAAMQLQLKQIKDAQGEAREQDLAADQQYWTEKLATVKGNTEEEKSLRVKIESEILSVKKAIRAQERALAEEDISFDKSIGEQEISNKRAALQFGVDMGKTTARQEAATLKQLEQEKYQIEMAALNKRLELVKADALKRKQVEDQKVLLEKQHTAQILQIEQQTALKNQMFWQNMMSPIAHTMANTVKGMIQHTMSLKQALANIGQQIVEQFIEYETEKLTMALTAEATKTTSAVVGAEIRATAEETGAKRGLIATIAAALKTIAINAVKVISGVWSAISSIPIVGPFLAPVLALAAGAAVYGLASRISSAKGGYDIPSGVNPMTQLHENEMVLPAKHANAIRRMADGNGGAGGRPLHVHFNVQAMDSKSFSSFLSKNSRAIAGALHQEMSRFNAMLT